VRNASRPPEPNHWLFPSQDTGKHSPRTRSGRLPPRPVCDACGRNAWPPPGPGRARMPGRCGSSSWTSEAALRQRPVSGRAPHAGYTPWEARSITPELIRSVGCAPDQGCPRLPACALWHETENELPNSIYERALSSGELGQLAVDRGDKEGRSRSHNTRRNSQIRCDSFLVSCPAEPSARASAGD
jgi:hypothetical protein